MESVLAKDVFGGTIRPPTLRLRRSEKDQCASPDPVRKAPCESHVDLGERGFVLIKILDEEKLDRRPDFRVSPNPVRKAESSV